MQRSLEQEGDDSAIAEYAAAVRLDPGNQDALRSYAAGLVIRNDERGALSSLKRLYKIGKRPDDLRNLTAHSPVQVLPTRLVSSASLMEQEK